jgi:hypothetical protein
MRPPKQTNHRRLIQVWNDKEALPTGYGASTLAEWAAAQGK